MNKVKEKFRRKVPQGMISLDEPVFKDGIASDIDLIHAYHWYGNNYDIDEGRKWLRTYLKNNNVSADRIELIEKDNTPMVVCSIARILNRGTKVPERTLSYIQKYINNVQIALKQSKKVAYVRAPSTEDKTEYFMYKIELEIDELIKGNESSYSFYTEAKVENLSKNTIKVIMERITPRYLQVKSPEYKEHFTTYSKKQIERFITFYNGIISDCERLIGTARVVKKPRKTKEKSVDKVLKKFKYKKQDDVYKITSIDPTKVLKASTLVVFNTKYRYMMLYIAEENKTLFVKGTTIINFDQSKSLRKTIRKPQETLNKILSGTPASILKTFESIKTAPVPVTSGRINEEIILLRAS